MRTNTTEMSSSATPRNKRVIAPTPTPTPEAQIADEHPAVPPAIKQKGKRPVDEFDDDQIDKLLSDVEVDKVVKKLKGVPAEDANPIPLDSTSLAGDLLSTDLKDGHIIVGKARWPIAELSRKPYIVVKSANPGGQDRYFEDVRAPDMSQVLQAVQQCNAEIANPPPADNQEMTQHFGNRSKFLATMKARRAVLMKFMCYNYINPTKKTAYRLPMCKCDNAYNRNMKLVICLKGGARFAVAAKCARHENSKECGKTWEYMTDPAYDGDSYEDLLKKTVTLATYPSAEKMLDDTHEPDGDEDGVNFYSPLYRPPAAVQPPSAGNNNVPPLTQK